MILATALAAACLFPMEGAPLPSGNTLIYVDAASGLETYLPAALQNKHVAASVTTDRSKADFAVESGARLVDLKSGDVIFAQAVDAKSSKRTLQNTANACVRRLTEAVGTYRRVPKAQEGWFKSLVAKDPAFTF